ncbi:MAG: hypothetical protein ACK4KW_10090 [Gemmobacter sp.]
MKSVALIATLTLLAACGADGPPEAPTRAGLAPLAPANDPPGVRVSGEARFGIVREWH